MRRITPAFLGFASTAIGVGVLLGRFDASAASPKPQQFSGIITSVDHFTSAVVVERRLWGLSIGRPTTVILTPQTELLTADGQPLTPDRLEAGQRVTVNCDDDGGRPVARSITVRPSEDAAEPDPFQTPLASASPAVAPASPAGPPIPTDVPAPTPEATPSQERPSTLLPDL